MSLKQIIFKSRFWSSFFFGKNVRELNYWKSNIQRMENWFDGTGDYYFPNPTEEQKITGHDRKTNVILTYTSIYLDHASYLDDLKISKDEYQGLKIADIGCGPLPTVRVFEGCKEKYCVDHLIEKYQELGYPQKDFFNDVDFVNSKSESMPFESGYLDAVISVNALDHVDDFEKTSTEIRRVLKKGGRLDLLINCHSKVSSTEPLALNENLILSCFQDIENFRVIHRNEKAYGFEDGVTILFSNRP